MLTMVTKTQVTTSSILINGVIFPLVNVEDPVAHELIRGKEVPQTLFANRESVTEFILYYKIILYFYIILLHISNPKGHHQARTCKGRS
jgi:hypothetical protein